MSCLKASPVSLHEVYRCSGISHLLHYAIGDQIGLTGSRNHFLFPNHPACSVPGVIAAYTLLPVVGVPIKSNTLSGIDSLYSIVQMPKGIPVATVAINGSANAALLAVQILALGDEKLHTALQQYRQEMAEGVQKKDRILKEMGVEDYLKEKK